MPASTGWVETAPGITALSISRSWAREVIRLVSSSDIIRLETVLNVGFRIWSAAWMKYEVVGLGVKEDCVVYWAKL